MISRGQTRVNGVLQFDPPDIAVLRESGQIAYGVIPEITTREPGQDDEFVDYRQAEPTVPDDQWLKTLPVRRKLAEPLKAAFDLDALLYRSLEQARRSYAGEAANVIGKTRGKGLFRWRLSKFLAIEGPDKWKVCPPTTEGGCDGVGEIEYFGECPKCKGAGYWL